MKLSLIAALAFTAVGCSASSDFAASNAAATTDTQRLMDFLDYPDTDVTLLDATVKLDSRAAKNIVTARDGADGVYPSNDDAPFTTVAQLDAVSYVGSATIAKLQAYANAHPAPASETVEGVAFSGWQSVAVVWGVNHATAADLDQFLDSRAAKALAAGAPFTSVAQMGPVSYVGATALTALRGHALAWWAASKGFVLDEATRAGEAQNLKTAMANDAAFATVVQGLADGDGTESAAILSALENEIDTVTKPLVGTTYADRAAAIAAIDAAGAVESLAKTGEWSYLESIGLEPPTVLACVASFESSVIPKLTNLLFMSESDRPFDVVSFVGAGTKAPTAASVLALLNAPAGSTASLRSVSDFYGDLEADDAAAAAVEAEFGTLKDVVYVAVINPNDPVLVDVYLVGRTSCGDLVGLHSISVET